MFGDPSPALVALIVGGDRRAARCSCSPGRWPGPGRSARGSPSRSRLRPTMGLGLPAADLDGAPGAWRVAVVRLLGLAPVVIVAALAWRPFYDATYRELVLPQDLVTPLPLRILGEVPWVVIAVAGVWLLSDAAAAVGVRRLVLERRAGARGLAAGLGATSFRRPQRIIPTALRGRGRARAPGRPGAGWRPRSAGRACATSSSADATRSSSSARSRSGSRSGWAVSCSPASGPPSGPRRGRWRCRCAGQVRLRHPTDASRVHPRGPGLPGLPCYTPVAARPRARPARLEA